MLGEELSDQRVVEKILVCLLGRFESKISSLEENKDFAHISLAMLMNALQAIEHRRSLRMEKEVEDTLEGALVVWPKGKQNSSGRRKQLGETGEICKSGENKEKYPPWPYCKKKNHSNNYCWCRPRVKCRACNQFGHAEKICKNKGNHQEPNQQGQEAQVAKCQ